MKIVFKKVTTIASTYATLGRRISKASLFRTAPQRKLFAKTSTSTILLVVDNAEDAIFVLLGKEGHLTKIIRQD